MVGGCGSDPENDGNGGPDGGFGEWAGNCTRVPALIAEERSCTRDDDCPCSMACTLGRCQSECTENAKCAAGLVCDAFGRCASPDRANRPLGPGDTAVTPPARPDRNDGGVTPQSLGLQQEGDAPAGGEGTPQIPLDRGTLRLSRAAIDLLTPEATGSFELLVSGGALDASRVVAGPGVLIDCTGGGAFTQQCMAPAVQPGARPPSVRVKSEGNWPTTDERVAVVVYAGGEELEVGVTKRGAPRGADVAREGDYEGTAYLVGAGLTARTTQDTLPPEVARLRLTVKARVFPQEGGKYTVSFDESRRAVFPAGAVGTFSLTSGSTLWQLNVPSRQYLGEDLDAPAVSALDVNAAETMTNATFSNGVLQGDLIAKFEGVTTAQYAPFVRWRLTMTRVGDLPVGISTPSASGRAVADVVARANAAFPEEGSAGAGISNFNALGERAKAEAAWCTPAGGVGIGFGATPDARGDLQCGNGVAQRAFAVTLGQLAERGEYIDDCVRAFKSTNTAFEDAQPCANRARAFSAMAWAFGPDRRRALNEAGALPEPALSRLGSRAVQLWLGALSVTAADPTRLAVLGPILPGGAGMEKLRYYAQYDNAFAALQQSVAAWNVILHPRIGVALAAMPPAALEAPDYRPDFGGSGAAGEQKVGVPVNMLAALTSQLDGVTGLVDALANQRISVGDANRYAVEVSNFMPRSIVVFAMAQGLRDAARSNGEQTWENSWRAARAKYGAALATLSTNLRALESQQNPLGIAEGDLPLYRLGEQDGANSRFSAVSDSLLGREDSLDPAIAPVLIDRARDAEAMARESLVRVLERDYQSELQTAATERNILDLKRRYGEQVTSLCGYDVNALDVLDNPALTDPNTCYLADSCVSKVQGSSSSSRSDTEISQLVCRFSKIRASLGEVVSSGDPAVDAQMDALEPQYQAGAPFPALPVSLREGLANLQRLTGVAARIPDNLNPAPVFEATQLCESARQATMESRTSGDTCTTTDDCPASTVCGTEGKCVTPEELPSSCYQGAMGAQLLALKAAATDLEIARAEFNDYTKAYENALAGCNILSTAKDTAKGYFDKYNKTMSSLADAKAAMDVLEKAFGVAREITQTQGTDPLKGALLGVSIGLGVAETAAFAASQGIGVKMDNLTRDHEAMLDALDRNTEISVCLNEATAQLIGQEAAALRVQRQQQEIETLLYDFADMYSSVGASLSEGLASVEYERARAVLPANADYWLDANIDLFQQRLRRARRALYLAILGVEYEFQQSSAERANVLAAQSTAELEAILGRVRDGVRRGAPSGGGNPTELRSVLSMRDNVLRLADHSNLGPGWHNLTETERFQLLLVSPQFAVYGAGGEYLGQEIPFSLAPGGAGTGQTAGVPLFSGLSCAERLWSVNAVIQGAEVMRGTDTSLTTLQVRKRNTFQSQWCSANQRGAQVSSTRPGVNLFIDPLSASSWNDDGALAALTSVSQTNAFSFATVQARLNVARPAMESDDYTNGASNALAGRGAFGEYALFVPRTSLSVEGGPGLVLQNVDDILIRLDYVAAERQ